MERRRFVILALAGTAAVSLPLSHCGPGADVTRPELLYSLVGKSKTIAIGKSYVERYPSESDRNKLMALISATLNEQPASPVNVRIQNEFRNGKVVIINGWILSVTEARQSALYYLNTLS
jgi:hypothetical protein